MSTASCRAGEVKNLAQETALTIASAVEEQTVTTSEINRSVGDAALGFGEIATNIAGIAGAAQRTTRGVTQSQEAIASLALMSAQLKVVVDQFVV